MRTGSKTTCRKINLLDKLKLQVAAHPPPGFSQTELTVAKLGNKAALHGVV
ncbi:ATP-dependent Zn protease [Paenibacillus endophyticus]|uniref:ATP-dependent Zn protease n=1 Tax=Paenibacillus endophyticus TaxID=1294268 RepID=A0A7W5GDM3_9BACL|nr:hypothetical protein [Paenibacillus endophyticus]MBB3155217.1 ATP-dependent Zn protease [Paenibacillus endophyticus]